MTSPTPVHNTNPGASLRVALGPGFQLAGATNWLLREASRKH